MADQNQALAITVVVAGGDAAAADVLKIAAAFEALGVKLDRLTAAMTKPVASVNYLELAHKQLATTLTDANNKLISLSQTLESKVTNAAKLATEAILGLGLATGTVAAKAASQVQQTAVGIQAFEPGLSYAQAYQQTQFLQRLTNPLSLSTVTGGYQSILAGGASVTQAQNLIRNLVNISANRPDAGGTFSNLSQAVNLLQQQGTLDPRLVRNLRMQGVDLTALLQQQFPGLSPLALQQWIKTGTAVLPAGGVLSALSGPLNGPLAGFAGGQQAFAGTLTGAFGELRKDITYGIADALTNAQQSGPIDRAAKWLGGAGAGLQGSVTSAITGAMPDIIKYLDSLGKELPPLEKGAEGLLKAAEPLGRTLLAVGQAVIPMVTILEHSATNLLKSPLVHFLEDVVSEASKLGPVRTIVVDIFEALLAYNALASTIGVIQGLSKTLGALQTVFPAGAHSIGQGQLGAAATMQTAAETMLTAANVMAGAAGTETAGGIGVAGAGASAAGIGVAGVAGTIGLGVAAGIQADRLRHQGTKNPVSDLGGWLLQQSGKGVADWLQGFSIFGGGGGLNTKKLGLPSGDKGSLKGNKLTLDKGDKLQGANGMYTLTAPITVTINTNDLGRNPSAVGGQIGLQLQNALEAWVKQQQVRGTTGGGG